VKYLLQTASHKVNPLDRWGSTPLNYAIAGSEISKYLLSRGAVNGTVVPTLIYVARSSLTENEATLFFAA